MNTKTEQLNLLLRKWEESQKSENEKESDSYSTEFCYDGIIDEEKYNKQKIKVLFISNEANLSKNDHNSEEKHVEDRRQHFLEYKKCGHDDWPGKLRERVSCLFQVIINDYTKRPNEVADCFAFINLNKHGGGNFCDIDHLIEYCTIHAKELREEINIIEPDIIIWLACNSFDSIIPKTIGVENNGFILPDRRTIPVVRTWHTSYSQIPRSIKRLGKFEDTNIDKQAYKLYTELQKLKEK